MYITLSEVKLVEWVYREEPTCVRLIWVALDSNICSFKKKRKVLYPHGHFLCENLRMIKRILPQLRCSKTLHLSIKDFVIVFK